MENGLCIQQLLEDYCNVCKGETQDTALCCGKHYIYAALFNMASHDLDQYAMILMFYTMCFLRLPVCVCVLREAFMDGRGSQRIRETDREGNKTVYVPTINVTKAGWEGVVFFFSPGDLQLINQT